MNLLKTIGLQTKGPYCFYCVSPDSAVLVGTKKQRDGKRVVPERIGKFTVRGIDEPLANGRIYDAYTSLSQKEKDAVQEKLNHYARLSSMYSSELPSTIEYIGCDILNYSSCLISANVRYIRKLIVIGSGTITLPNTIHYLGRIKSDNSSVLRFEGEEALMPPHHSLSAYLGREVDDRPQIGEGALQEFRYLREIYLGDHFVKIGNGAMSSEGLIFSYRLHIPRQLESVQEDEFRDAEIEKLIYPDDLSETLRRRKIDVMNIQHLIIRDIGELKNYTSLLAQGSDLEEYPEKCLYHFMRFSQHIYFTDMPEEIFDGMFEGCYKLYSIVVGSEETDADLRGFTLPKRTSRIGHNAFCKCSRLNSIQFCEELQYIGNQAFYDCGFSTLSLPASLNYIGDEAFAQCKQLITFNIPDNLQYLGVDVCSNCNKLRLTPDVLQRLSAFLDAGAKLVNQWSEKVNQYIEEGDKKLSQNPRSIENRQDAYRQYCKALELDPFSMKALQGIERLVVSDEVGSGISAFGLNKLRTYLLGQNSTELVNYLDYSTFEMLDAVSTITFCAGDNIRDAWISYCMNTNQEAAVEIMRFLFDCIDEHPNVGYAVTLQMKIYLGSIAVSPTRNKTPETTKEFQKLCNKVSDYCGWQNQCRPVTKEYLTIAKLTPTKMMEEYKKALQETNLETSYYNAEFWLDMVLKFNPKMKIPVEFITLKQRFDSAQKSKNDEPFIMPGFTFPAFSVEPDTFGSSDTFCSSDTFHLPDTTSSGPYLDEDDRILREIASDSASYVSTDTSWGQAAIDLENDWIDLNALGFWSDKGWQ